MLEQQEPDPAISSSMFFALLTFIPVFCTMPRMCFLDQAEVLKRCMAAAGELHDISSLVAGQAEWLPLRQIVGVDTICSAADRTLCL
jgi:hypothetical protein